MDTSRTRYGVTLLFLLISAVNSQHYDVPFLTSDESTFEDQDELPRSLSSSDSTQALYEIALEYTNDIPTKPVDKLVLIRVPKAGSSALSTTARRLVGCTPAGPCCPEKTVENGQLVCPGEQFYCKQVIGCDMHYLERKWIVHREIPKLLMLRHPYFRSLSAFHYGGIHSNYRYCHNTEEECFREYVVQQNWTNPATKLINGDFSYANATACASGCRFALDFAQDVVHNVKFIAISEMWELSLLLIAATDPTTGINESEMFRRLSRDMTRVNKNTNYQVFSRKALTTFRDELKQQNEYDLALYHTMLVEFCARLHKLGLWKYTAVREVWVTNTRRMDTGTVPQCDG